MEAKQRLQNLGFKLVDSEHTGNCLYDAIAGQTGRTTNDLRTELRQHLTGILQNPNPALSNHLDGALQNPLIHSSLNELAGFYLDGRLSRHGEWGELMLLPLIVHILNRPILLINTGAVQGHTPNFLIQTDLTFIQLTNGETTQHLNISNPVVLIFADDSYYGLQPESSLSTENWQQLLLANLAFIFKNAPPVPVRNLPFDPQNPDENYGSGSQIAYNNPGPEKAYLAASLPYRDHEFPLRPRLIRQACDPCAPSPDTPCFNVVLATTRTRIDGFDIFYPKPYRHYLAYQLELYRQTYNMTCRIRRMQPLPKLPLRVHKTSVMSENSDISDTSTPSRRTSTSSLNESPESKDQKTLTVHQLIQQFENLPASQTEETSTPTEAAPQSNPKSRPRGKFRQSVDNLRLRLKVARAFDTYRVYTSSTQTATGVPSSYLWRLAKAAGDKRILFGNRNVALGAKRHLEAGEAATKNYRMKNKSSDLNALSSILIATPSLTKDRRKSLEEQDKIRDKLKKDKSSGQIDIIDLTMNDDNLQELITSGDVTQTILMTDENGHPLEVQLHDNSLKDPMTDLTLKRPQHNMDWDVYWTKKDHLTRVQAVTDDQGRMVTADLDPILVSFPLHELDMAHTDKRPLPLITHTPTKALLQRLLSLGVLSKSQTKSYNALNEGMADFFYTEVFIKAYPFRPGDPKPEIDKNALRQQIFMNPQLPTLRVLEKYWGDFQKKWINLSIYDPEGIKEPEVIYGFLVRIPREHPDMGNVDPRAVEVVDIMNKALQRPENNPAVHHNHDAHSLASNPDANYPADIYIPERLETTDDQGFPIRINKGAVHIENEERMKGLVRACKDNDWYITLNHPLWPQLSAIRSRRWREACEVADKFLLQHREWLESKDNEESPIRTDTPSE